MRRFLYALLSLTLIPLAWTVAGGPASADGAAEGGLFVGVPYARLVDTQTGVGGSSAAFSEYQTRTYQVTGTNGVPSKGVSAVLIDVNMATSTSTTDTRTIVWTAGTPMPAIGQVHYNVDTVPRSNTVAVAPNAAGQISVQSGRGTSHLNVDIQGYFTENTVDSSTAPGGFVPLTPKRIADTSTGVAVPQGQVVDKGTITVQATGANGIPAGAKALFANVTVWDINSDGGLKIVPSSADLTAAPQRIGYSVGGPTTSGMAIPLSANGQFVIQNLSTVPPGDVTIKVDVEGYFSGSSADGGGFTPSADEKLYDSESISSPMAVNVSRTIPVGGRFDVPFDDVAGLMLTVEAHAYTGTGSVEVYTTGKTPTGLGSTSFNSRMAGDSISSTVVIAPDEDGQVSIKNASSGTVQVKLNLQGYFAAAPDATTEPQFDPAAPEAPLLNPAEYSDSVAAATLELVEQPAEQSSSSQTFAQQAFGVQQALESGGATDVTVTPAADENSAESSPSGSMTIASSGVPIDAFKVRSMWANYWKNGKQHIVFYGFWNMRDDYIATGSPYDISAIAVQGFPRGCWTQVSDSVVAKDYMGQRFSAGLRYSSTQGRSVWAINDRISGFRQLTDNGIHQIDMRKDGSGDNCRRRKAGSYYFVHSMGGGNSQWSASVTVGALSVSYTGSKPESLRKAAKYSYYN